MSARDRIVVTIGADPPPRLDKALARDAPPEAGLSRTRLARLIAEGAVCLDGEPVASAKARVAAGAKVEIAIAPPVASPLSAEAIPLAVVHEDDALLVVDKPAGMVVHPGAGNRSGTLVNALLHHCGATLTGVGGSDRPGIVHRIDKDTSGLLVVAKTDRAQIGLAAQFAAHSVARRYTALVHGVPDPATPRLAGMPGVAAEPGGVLRLSMRLGRHPVDRQRQAVLRNGGRHAVTRLRVLALFGQPPVAAQVECWLETGRTHQIRVHLAHLGHPILGDPVYGARRKLPERAFAGAGAAQAAAFPRQALHAGHLGFRHPVTDMWLAFDSPLPQDMERLREALSSLPQL